MGIFDKMKDKFNQMAEEAEAKRAREEAERIEIRDRRKNNNPFGTKRVETTYTRVEMTPEAMEKARRDVERKALEMRVHDLEDKG